jgi:PAS domain-containing protein
VRRLHPHSQDDVELARLPHPALVISSKGRIKDVNGLAEALTGYSRRELVGEFLSAAVMTSTFGLRLRRRIGPDLAVEIQLSPHERYSTLAIVRPRSAADAIDPERLELQPTPTDLSALLARVVDRIVATRDRGRVRLDAPVPIT